MEIKKIICKSGREYNIVNETWETSRAWGHKSTLIAPWGEVESHKVRYYNRTWESYTYETCMLCAIDEIEETEKNKFINDYKYQNNIDRFKKGQKDEVIKMFEETEKAKELKALKEVIRNRDFD